MADVLSVLREFMMKRKIMIQYDNRIIFGEKVWRKTVKTNYVIWGSGKNGERKEYYTLESILFLLVQNNYSHRAYVRKAIAERVPRVKRINRLDLLRYVKGVTRTSLNIDKYGPFERPKKMKRDSYESIQKVFKNPKLDDNDPYDALIENVRLKFLACCFPSVREYPKEIRKPFLLHLNTTFSVEPEDSNDPTETLVSDDIIRWEWNMDT